jgi:nucleoid DNA-binding protein
MSNFYRELPPEMQMHLKKMLASFNLEDNEASLELLAKTWIDKKNMFASQIKLLDMEEPNQMRKDDPRAFLALTYSGSLLAMGLAKNEMRWLEYASIKDRVDVPEIITVEEAQLKSDITVNKAIEFLAGPIKSTSSIYKLAACHTDTAPMEQEKRIREAMIYLTNGFVKINRSVTKEAHPEQFNLKEMIRFIAKKNNLTLNETRLVIEDLLNLIETGMLLGDRVSLGKIGKLYLRQKKAQKARVITHPQTGTELTIKAKPAILIPKISFSRALKTRAGEMNPDSGAD